MEVADEGTVMVEAVEAAAAVVVADPPTTVAKLPDIEGPSTQTFLQESGQDAPCIIDSGKGVISVLNPPPAHGKMFSRRDLQNETGTSSASK